MQLQKGYSIGQIDENEFQFALVKGECPCVGEFTGLITECETMEEAIDIFNKHIPILADNVLDEPILIQKKK
jgi:hypothetical protein